VLQGAKPDDEGAPALLAENHRRPKDMKLIAIITTMLVIIAAFGCTRTAYDSLRYRQEMQCQNLQGYDREECERRSGVSYDEYQRQLKERPQDK